MGCVLFEATVIAARTLSAIGVEDAVANFTGYTFFPGPQFPILDNSGSDARMDAQADDAVRNGSKSIFTERRQIRFIFQMHVEGIHILQLDFQIALQRIVGRENNLFLIDEIRSLSNLQVQVVVATPKDIRRMITALPNSKVFVIDDIIEDSESGEVTLIEEAIEDLSDVTEVAGQSPVIRLVNYIIFNAVREGASDIHIEPAERCLRVRYRIDGAIASVMAFGRAHLHTQQQSVYEDGGLFFV